MTVGLLKVNRENARQCRKRSGSRTAAEKDGNKNGEMSQLYQKIYDIVMQIPEGKVATYGQVAGKIGNKGLARVVGNALHVNPYQGIVPCHRVVNAKGELSGAFAFGSYEVQRYLLEEEGVIVRNFTVDLEKYGVDW